jgi:hypothetical protein
VPPEEVQVAALGAGDITPRPLGGGDDRDLDHAGRDILRGARFDTGEGLSLDCLDGDYLDHLSRVLVRDTVPCWQRPGTGHDLGLWP